MKATTNSKEQGLRVIKIRQKISQQYAEVWNEWSFHSFTEPLKVQPVADLKSLVEDFIGENCGQFYDQSFYHMVMAAITSNSKLGELDWQPQGYHKMAWESIQANFAEFSAQFEAVKIVFVNEEIRAYVSNVEGWKWSPGIGEDYEVVIYR